MASAAAVLWRSLLVSLCASVVGVQAGLCAQVADRHRQRWFLVDETARLGQIEVQCRRIGDDAVLATEIEDDGERVGFRGVGHIAPITGALAL
ncbi:hypothetical protein ACFQGA_09610 [Marinobacter koreensis]|uniref:Secreted protein n=1 Tax=Marinobacter koreensis TaxID=335974 RepID=A0ABW0RL29_9GAMM|nr:hypothetical protein [Marinobacter koreensis]MCK7547200.1 hypothetical protein [Marinobacter koreensis]